MRKQLISLICVLLISAAAAGDCWALSRMLKVDIPFAFEVENQQLPSGTYWLDFITTGDGSLQVIRGVHGKALIFSTTSTSSQNASAITKLIFHRYGDRYFLTEISNWDGHTRTFAVSPKEKEAMRLQAAVQVSLLARASAAKE